ncbi:MAG TPA: NmrA family NAD(P)-binding protein [Pyrinomonadaceae bacterium]|nr:NmrA family NAD(P)-binding protein [Pyrinomonadaceae bacterium]
MRKTILIAGATGNLGGRIVDALLKQDANVRAVARAESEPKKVGALKDKGVQVVQADLLDKNKIAKVCAGADCVVSALSGLRETVIDTQRALLDAAVEAKVPRFIPSVFSLDFANLVPGTNRNLDLRREFESYLDDAPIATTSIFNGAFMDLLTTDMPLILFKFRRILYWGAPNVKMDLTTMDDVAEYTARAAIDTDTPRRLRIAGDTVSAADVKKIVSKVTSKRFHLLRAGSISLLNVIINIAQFFSPAKNKLYPAWQGMQYMRDMMEGRAEFNAHDNNRYSDMRWTSVEKFLAAQNVKIK